MQEIKKDMYLIDKAELLQVIMEKKNALWRLCQICCSFPKAENHYEVTYSFANGYDFANYRLIVEKDEDVPSISRVYKSAMRMRFTSFGDLMLKISRLIYTISFTASM